LSEQRKLLEAMAAAQAERETALHDREEALKQRARVARVRNIALVAVSILALLAVATTGLSLWSYLDATRQKQIAEQRKEQASDLLNSALGIITNVDVGDKLRPQVAALFAKGAKIDDAPAMFYLGLAYQLGSYGVPQDFNKAGEWYYKAAVKGHTKAMVYLALLYDQDNPKAREWYEMAAAKDDTQAMKFLGQLYQNGDGVPQDFTKAREWYEKAVAKGDANAKDDLERLAAYEAFKTGRYAEALQRREAWATEVEAEETKRDGKPGQQTAQQLRGVAWYALFTKEFTKALAVADRGQALSPDNVESKSRVHALMFMGRDEEAKTLYLAHKGEVSKRTRKLWEQVIAEDFAELREASLTHPMMADIEKELAVSR
jgi:TPR repeat protein